VGGCDTHGSTAQTRVSVVVKPLHDCATEQTGRCRVCTDSPHGAEHSPQLDHEPTRHSAGHGKMLHTRSWVYGQDSKYPFGRFTPSTCTCRACTPDPQDFVHGVHSKYGALHISEQLCVLHASNSSVWSHGVLSYAVTTVLCLERTPPLHLSEHSPHPSQVE